MSGKSCRHCNKNVVDSVHCETCNAAFHPSCAKQAKVVKKLENKKEVVNCCIVKKILDMDEGKLKTMMKEVLIEQLSPFKKEMEREMCELKKSIQHVSDFFDEQKQLIENMAIDMKNIKEENNKLKQKLEVMEKKLNSQEEKEKERNIIINGVDKQPELNTSKIIEKIFTSVQLDIQPSNVLASYRLGKQENAPILVRLADYQTKVSILKKSKELKGINPNSCNLRGTGKIYFNEDLTSQAQLLYRRAREYKRTKNLHSVYSFNGKIYLKKSNGSPPVWIKTAEDLQ